MSEPPALSASPRGKYLPIFQLGRGGMADVILALVQGPGGFNKLQVVKQLRGELAAEPEFTNMFLDEARLSARINHPNVVQTHEVGFDGRHYFIAMEYLEGETLESCLRAAQSKQPGGLSLAVFLRIVCEVLDGLHFAHELTDFDGQPLNVVHRDISPHNIFVTYEGVPKLLDFGIAKAADSSGETRTGIIKGKVAYMAPEQLRSARRIDRRADIFAVGVILWRAITGRRLWKGLSDLDVLQKISAGDIPSPLAINPQADPRLVAICGKCLAIDPDERYQTAAELQEALEEFTRSLPQKVGRRDLARLMNELFAERRAQARKAIDARIREVSQATRELTESTFGRAPMPGVGPPVDESRFGGPASVPAPAPLPAAGTPAGVSVAPPHFAETAGIRYHPDYPSVPPPSAGTPVADARQHVGESPLHPAVEPDVQEFANLAKRRQGVGLAILFILLGTLAFVGAFALERLRLSSLPQPPAAQPDPGSIPGDKTRLTVRVSPESAQIFVDDDPIEGSEADFPRDGAAHRVRAEAPGYLPRQTVVVFNAPSQTVPLQLLKDQPPAAPSP
ncbi:MAG TPA: serine/threonine-protein kinase [Polyangiaceae bacterium]|nr:serine/threonine-protein kinase [Polyangiaceae bacterium]